MKNQKCHFCGTKLTPKNWEYKEEWHAELLREANLPKSTFYCHASMETIRQIQADAMRHCAAIAIKYAIKTNLGPRHAAISVARLIEREIRKLSKKEDA